MAYKLVEIEGIGSVYAGKLSVAGILTTRDLLERCGDARGREQVAQACGLRAEQLLKWANMADLMRIKGIGGEFAELLEAAGVDTVKELRNRNPENLASAMSQTNQLKRLTRRVPSKLTTRLWVEQAKLLDPIITH